MIKNYKDVKESYAVDISVTTKYFFTETSTGASYRKTVKDIANQTKSISYVDAAIAAYEINLEPHWSNESKLTIGMREYIDKILANNYDETLNPT
jgi:hypothetical protein